MRVQWEFSESSVRVQREFSESSVRVQWEFSDSVVVNKNMSGTVCQWAITGRKAKQLHHMLHEGRCTAPPLHIKCWMTAAVLQVSWNLATFKRKAEQLSATVLSHLCSFCTIHRRRIGYICNSTARNFPIQKCTRKVAVQLKSHGESEIARN